MVKTLRELYPNLSEEELNEVEENLDAYAAFLWRMAKRMVADGSLDRLLEEKEKLSSSSEM